MKNELEKLIQLKQKELKELNEKLSEVKAKEASSLKEPLQNIINDVKKFNEACKMQGVNYSLSLLAGGSLDGVDENDEDEDNYGDTGVRYLVSGHDGNGFWFPSTC